MHTGSPIINQADWHCWTPIVALYHSGTLPFLVVQRGVFRGRAIKSGDFSLNVITNMTINVIFLETKFLVSKSISEKKATMLL